MQVSEQDIKGDLGETEFELLAKRAGFTVHEPDRDRHGWDRLLEISLPPDPTIPLDRRPALLSCFVQIKATDSRTYEDVKLDVLERAVKDPAPWFFAFVVLGNDRRPTDLQLVHVDEHWTATVLKRLREVQANGSQDQVHKKTMRVDWTTARRLEPNDHQGVREFIIEQVGDPAGYSERKLQRAKTVGYGDGTHRLTVTLGDGETNADFVDLLIGARPSIRTQAVACKEVRFDIPLPGENWGEGVLSVTPRSVGSVVVSLETAEHRMEMKAGYFPAPANIPEELWKARIANTVVQMILHPHDSSMSFAINCPPLAVLEDLEAAAELMAIIDSNPPKINLRVEFDGEVACESEGSPDINTMRFSPQLRRLLTAAKTCARVVRMSGCRVDGESVAVAEIEAIANRIEGLEEALKGTKSVASAVLRRFDDSLFHVGSAVFLLNAIIPFEKFCLSYVVSLEGAPKREESDGKVSLVVEGPASILRQRRLLRRDFVQINRIFVNEVYDAEVRKRPDAAFFHTWKRGASKGSGRLKTRNRTRKTS